MRASDVTQVVAALNTAGVRYLIVGGLAVVAHGYLRATKDVDIVVDLDGANDLAAVRALASIAFQPAIPVPIEQFADGGERRRWIDEEGAVVFPLFSARDPMMRGDLFLEVPFDFDATFRRRIRRDVAPGVTGTFVPLAELLEMKRRAGRPQDLADIAALDALQAHADDGTEGS